MCPLRRLGSGDGYRQHRHGCHDARAPYALAVEIKSLKLSQVDVDDNVLLRWIVCQASKLWMMRPVLISIRVCITSLVRLFYVKKVGSTDPSCTFPWL